MVNALHLETYLYFNNLFLNDRGEKLQPYSYQLEIATPILNKQHKYFVITATTRAGKSFIVALTSILYAIKYPNSKILLIAPIFSQAEKLFGYVIKHLYDSPAIRNQVIKQNLSFVGFSNGSTIELMSAHGGGERLLGSGGDLIIVDESALIPDDVFNEKIMRMLGESPDSILVQLGNAIKLNHFYEDFNNPKHERLHISWERCVEEGRLTQEFIEDQRSRLTASAFKMWYDSEFVENIDNVVIPLSKINACIALHEREPDKFTKTNDGYYVLGVDVARGGLDYTILSVIWKDLGFMILEKQIQLDLDDLTDIAGRILNLHKEYKFQDTVVDDTGVGGGLTDILRNTRGYNVSAFKGGESPSPRGKSIFDRKKHEAVWNVRELIYNEELSIPKDDELVRQLAGYKLEYTASGKIQTRDDPNKSPDKGDSLIYGCYSRGRGAVVLTYV